MVGPAGLSYEVDASDLNTRMMAGFRANNRPRLGDLFRTAQAEYALRDMILTSPYLYNLLGDPTLCAAGACGCFRRQRRAFCGLNWAWQRPAHGTREFHPLGHRE